MRYFYQNKNHISLSASDKFASGGEGSIFMHPTNKGLCVKIYHTPKPSNLASLYSELMKLDGKYFIKPQNLLFTDDGSLAGFEMAYVDTSDFFILKKLLTKNFCNQHGYDRKFKFIVYKNLKAALESAHSCNIVIGDLNPYNILVNKNGDILFVDVDSYSTKDKPHSGVLLQDIRDFLLHPSINQQTDAFAFDVLVFWMFTYLHPFMGTTKMYKSMEERVAKKASVLSKIPDLILPNLYEPFSNQDIVKQFSEVFDGGRRFIVDLVNAGNIPIITPAHQPLNLSSTNLYIRMLLDGVLNIDCNDDILAVQLPNKEYKIFNMSNYGAFNQADNFIADAVFLGMKNFMKRVGNEYYNQAGKIKNLEYGNDFIETNINGSIFILNKKDNFAYKVAVDNILSGTVQIDKTAIFSPSTSQHDSVVTFIGDNNWLFLPNGINHNLIKTNLNIVNAYYRGGIYCIEYLENKQTRYGLFKVNNTTLEKVKDLTDFSYFDVKNNLIFVPQNGYIDLVSTINYSTQMTIDCPVSKIESKLFHTKAGMVIYEDGKVYLINKKQ